MQSGFLEYQKLQKHFWKRELLEIDDLEPESI